MVEASQLEHDPTDVEEELSSEPEWDLQKHIKIEDKTVEIQGMSESFFIETQTVQPSEVPSENFDAHHTDAFDPVQASATVEPIVEPPKKKHIPFNVLMLKQDKRHFEKQKTNEAQNGKMNRSEKQDTSTHINDNNSYDIKEEENKGYYEFPPIRFAAATRND